MSELPPDRDRGESWGFVSGSADLPPRRPGPVRQLLGYALTFLPLGLARDHLEPSKRPVTPEPTDKSGDGRDNTPDEGTSR